MHSQHFRTHPLRNQNTGTTYINNLTHQHPHLHRHRHRELLWLKEDSTKQHQPRRNYPSAINEVIYSTTCNHQWTLNPETHHKEVGNFLNLNVKLLTDDNYKYICNNDERMSSYLRKVASSWPLILILCQFVHAVSWVSGYGQKVVRRRRCPLISPVAIQFSTKLHTVW